MEDIKVNVYKQEPDSNLFNKDYSLIRKFLKDGFKESFVKRGDTVVINKQTQFSKRIALIKKMNGLKLL